MTFFKAAALALAITAFGVSPAVAQEQENPSTPGQIPDPSTYQGSQVLQQQSDQQDQQFRQQQQEQQQQYTPQNSGQYSRGSSGSQSYGQAPSQGAQCSQRLMWSLTELRGLVALGGSDVLDNPRYFTIYRRPSAMEKKVLMRWLAGRRRCMPLMTWNPNPVLKQAEMRGAQYTSNLIAALAQGQMTYGEFNYRRAQKYAAVMQFVNSH
jgi:hypothetical protein